MKKGIKTLAMWLIIGIIVIVLLTSIMENRSSQITYSELVTSIENGEVEKITISSNGKNATVKMKESKLEKEVNIPSLDSFMTYSQDYLKAYVTKVESASKGALILLSRKHYGFVKRLFELEIPEINDGTIIIYSVAREAGERTKVAVYSENPNVEAIGSCIGEKGCRINPIIEELNGEKVDLVLYEKDPAKFIENALSPAKNLHIIITDEKEKEALVVVNKDNLSLAIGKKGLNVRLAARLTHYKLDIKTVENAKELGINFVE